MAAIYVRRLTPLSIGLLCCLCVVHVVHSQVIRGNVVNALSNEAVPYATLHSIKSPNGLHADEAGYFEWNVTDKRDSIVVSSVGYVSSKIAVYSLSKNIINQIELHQDSVILSEVTVKGSGRSITKKIGFFDNKPGEGMGMGPGGISQNELFVNYYPNEDQRVGSIKKLSFDIKGFDFSQKSSKVKIRILSRNASSGLPDKDLLQRDIIVKINRLSPDIILDIEKLNISFPEDGIFIGLEFICESTFLFKKQSLIGQKTNCPRITMTKAADYKKEGQSYFWTFHRNKWQWICVSDGSVFPNRSWIGLVFKFGATILIYQ